MNKTLKIFSNITRVKILVCLLAKNKNVSGLVKNCNLSQSAVSQHLKILKDAGLVNCRISGRERVYRLNNREVGKISQKIITLINK